MRIREISLWHSGGGYEAIISGNYRKRGEEEPFDFFNHAERIKTSYEHDIGASKDPLFEILNRVNRTLKEAGEQAGKQAEEFFRKLFRG